jgi:MOSC domain-containing protein YiiM
MAITEPFTDTQDVLDWSGRVEGIFIAPTGGEPMRSVAEVLAVAGEGLEGDRYFSRVGTWSDRPGTGRAVTLIESEAVEQAGRDHGFEMPAGDVRRNIVTRGVPLNHLVGKEFTVGNVRLRGMRLCEPCAYVAELTGHPLVKALTHRGGLRAEIVEGGTILVGDPVRPAS